MLELQHQKAGSPAYAAGSARGGEAPKHIRRDQVEGEHAPSPYGRNPGSHPRKNCFCLS
jgi:hypothetical protein